MTGRILFIAFALTISSISCFSQKIHIKASNEPLSSVVKRLNAEVSFDNKLLSTYNVTIDKSFPSPYEAILYLISGKPLQVKKVSGVYIITAKQKNINIKPQQENAAFKNIPKRIPDISPPVNLSLSLNEIVITAKSHVPSLYGEDVDGTTRFTSFTANAMPGYSDNLVFNVLRMMPGIRASGEPSDELYVWGSSPGESCISFDGIPLFSMQSYNSNISYINPYMFTEVKYKRGILSADEGNQTGAKVEVISGMSPVEKTIFKAMVSTMSANCFGAIPIGKNCVVSIAYRHTLSGLFGVSTFDAYRNKKEKEKSSKTEYTNNRNSDSQQDSLSSAAEGSTITPNYRFQDLNVNITGISAKNIAYKLTLYGAKDYLKYSGSDTTIAYGNQTSYQSGISASLMKTWNDGNNSELLSYFSRLHSTQSDNILNIGSDSKENVSEYNLKFQQSGFKHNHGLTFGGEIIAYKVNSSLTTATAFQPTLFATQKYSIKSLNMETGIRADIMSKGIKWQPRVLLNYHFMKYLSFTSAWGIYNQYLVKNPFAIKEGQYKFSWDINTSLKSYNTVAGFAFDKDGLNISVEGYLKNIHNSEWVCNNLLGKYDFNLKGFDVSAKYNWKHGLIFSSWSLSKDPRQTDGVSNELKIGGILRYYPFTFSANYIYSHGYNFLLLPTSSYKSSEEKRESNFDSSTTYSRMDISGSYEKRFKYFGIATGISLINLFDTNNKKCVTTWIPRDYTSTFYTQASRFTPIIFIEIKI